MRQHPVRRLDEDRVFQAGQDFQFRPRHRGLNGAVQAGVAAAVQFSGYDLGGGFELMQPGAGTEFTLSIPSHGSPGAARAVRAGAA